MTRIEQTAEGISLTMAENLISENLLAGSPLMGDTGIPELAGAPEGYARITRLLGYRNTNGLYVKASGLSEQRSYGLRFNGSRAIVRVDHGKTYTLSLMARATGEVELDRPCRLEIFYVDAAGQTRYGRVKREDGTEVGTGFVPTSEWKQYSLTFMTDSEHDYLQVVIQLIQNGSVVFCRPMLNAGDRPIPWVKNELDYRYIGGNLLENTHTLMKGQRLLENRGTPGMFRQHASTKYTATGDGYFLSWYYPSGLMKPNAHYMLSFMARGSGILYTYFYGTNGTSILASETSGMETSTDGNGGTRHVLTGDWKQYWVLFRTSSTATETCSLGFRLMQAGYRAEIAEPKLEEGATVTGYTGSPVTLVEKTSIVERLLDTGIDIRNRTIDMTADRFTLRNNKGEKTMGVDEAGNMELSGTLRADAVYRHYVNIVRPDSGSCVLGAGSFYTVDGSAYSRYQNPSDERNLILLPEPETCAGREIEIVNAMPSLGHPFVMTVGRTHKIQRLGDTRDSVQPLNGLFFVRFVSIGDFWLVFTKA